MGIKKLLRKIGLGSNKGKSALAHANAETLGKGVLREERFREIISDPLNLLIERHPQAGYIADNGQVILHNGLKVPFEGKYSYYGGFSEILMINRGVHEPLEEYCFQEVLKKLQGSNIVMIELGAYWGHYSMWLKSKFQDARCILVEPSQKHIEAGRKNFQDNGFDGQFIQSFVSKDSFNVDQFISEENMSDLDILHSDIQGYELEMLESCENALKNSIPKYLFISTHSEDLHENCKNFISSFGYRIEVSSPVNEHTTSHDGFILASAERVEPIFASFAPIGRIEIANSSPGELLAYLNRVITG